MFDTIMDIVIVVVGKVADIYSNTFANDSSSRLKHCFKAEVVLEGRTRRRTGTLRKKSRASVARLIRG